MFLVANDQFVLNRRPPAFPLHTKLERLNEAYLAPSRKSGSYFFWGVAVRTSESLLLAELMEEDVMFEMTGI